MVSWSWYWQVSLELSCISLMPFRTFYVSSNECDEQRSKYTCVQVVILILRTEKLCGQPLFDWWLSANLASLLRDVWACWSILSAQRQSRWKSLLWCSRKCLKGRCKSSIFPSFYRGPIAVVLCIFLFLLSKETTWRTVPMVLVWTPAWSSHVLFTNEVPFLCTYYSWHNLKC